MHTKTKKIVITALFAALTCVATMIIHIPSPLHGYINLGDVIVLAAGFVTAFAVSLVAIKFLMEFVKKHTFTSFGIYRIALGALVLVYFLIKQYA